MLFLFVSLAAASAPVLLFIHRPSWLIWILAGCLVVGITTLAEVAKRRARPMTNLEKFLVVIAALFGESAVALLVVAAFGLFRLFSLLFVKAGISTRILWYVAVAIACFFLLVSLGMVGEFLQEAFFPKTGVGNAPLFPGFTWRKVALPGFLGLVAIAVLGLLAYFGWSYAYVGMILVLMIASAPVSAAFNRDKAPTSDPPVFEGVKALLVASGYQIWGRVQTGELVLDRLIAVFDLVAEKDGNTLAIQFKTSASSSEPVTWMEASALPTAVRAINRSAEKQQAKIGIHPMLVLFGRTADPSLRAFAKDESIGLAVVPSDAPLEGIAKGEFTPEELRDFARNYLGVGIDASGTGQTTPGLTAGATAW